MSCLGRSAWLALTLLVTAGPAAAAARIPVPGGTYCGPDASTIAIDKKADTIAIDGYTCGFPVLAADKLQSIQCRRDNGPPERREFDVRYLNGSLLYNGAWFNPCQH